MSHASSTPSPSRLAAAIALACATGGAHAVVITVDDGGDDGSLAVCNLRNAITAINYGNAVLYPACKATLTGLFGDNDTVKFSPALVNSRITLLRGQLANYAPITITGSGQEIYANGAGRALYTNAFTALSDLYLTGAQGSCLYANQAQVKLTHVDVTFCTSYGGGALAVKNGSAQIVNSSVVQNFSFGAHGTPGLMITNSTVSISGSSIRDNRSFTCDSNCGGGISALGSTLTISASTISGNIIAATNANVAGGLYLQNSKATLINATLADNEAQGSDRVAGAVLENHSAANNGVWLTNVTVSANVAQASGAAPTISAGGFLLGSLQSGSLNAANSIVSANSAAATPDVVVPSGTASFAYSLLGSALAPSFGGNGNVFNDAPRLTGLAYNGGSSDTLRLLPGSPAIDAGSNALAVNSVGQALTTDQRGAARIAGGTVDIGAYEYPGDPADRIFSDAFDR